MKRIIIDLDGTIAMKTPEQTYAQATPNAAVVDAVRRYAAQGFTIVIHTSRHMRTHGGNVGKINAETLPQILDWLKAHDVPFDEVIVGKPWCGLEGFYVDDKAVRPDEFAGLSYEQLCALTGNPSPSTDGGGKSDCPPRLEESQEKCEAVFRPAFRQEDARNAREQSELPPTGKP